MNAGTDPGTRDQPEGLTHTEALRMRVSDRLRSILVPIGLYLVVGLFLVVVYGTWPDTIPEWILWIVFAPVIVVLGELIFLLLAVPFMLLAKVPPFSWLAWWLKCEDGEGDPLLRFAGLAFGLLAVFLLALKLFFPE